MKEVIDNSIDSLIVSILKNGPLSAVNLLSAVQSIRGKTPKQSVYLALRKLKSKEVVAISGKRVSLHQTWVSMMTRFFADVEKNARDKKRVIAIGLEEKESISYHFNSLVSLDMFWGHEFMVQMENTSHDQPVLLYNPHQWFLIARQESELNLINEAKKKGLSWIQIIGSKDSLDIEAKRHFDGVKARCHLLESGLFNNNYYVNCFGDFLIEVWINKDSAKQIDDIYKSAHRTSKDLLERLDSIVKSKNFKHRMKISKDKSKSMKIKKMFKKYFIIN